VPTLDTAPPATRVTGRWTATVAADQAYFDANAIEGVEFPANAPSRTVDLPAPQVRIGRKSRSKGTDPELDLSAEPLDPGVSHSHALLTLNIDGVWLVSDLGSTNGTYLNDEPRPLTAGQTRTLSDGDRVHVGAWTTITLHAPTQAA
jgi:pSer/pThr/pTyr-binding forkhead associated (FHA) protein